MPEEQANLLDEIFGERLGNLPSIELDLDAIDLAAPAHPPPLVFPEVNAK